MVRRYRKRPEMCPCCAEREATVKLEKGWICGVCDTMRRAIYGLPPKGEETRIE
jgi:hypothetical protein